jgi:hypothetical protein
MAWDQQELFRGIVGEFAERAAAVRLAQAREAKWVAFWTNVLHLSDVRNSAQWRRRNASKAKAYGEEYRRTHRRQEVKRVRRWKLAKAELKNARRCVSCNGVLPSDFVVRARVAICIDCERKANGAWKRLGMKGIGVGGTRRGR